MKDPSQVRVTGPLGPYAEGFRAELARQGYASSSAVNQLKLVGHLSRWMTIEGLSAPELVPAEIERYVAARRAARYRHNLSEQGLRPLLRSLHVTGLSATPLAGAVPGVAPWRERSLPQGLSPPAVARLLGSCDQRSAAGRRDYAILVVLLRLGLRAGEAAALELDDIDWRRGELVVRGKADRREQLPLPVDVGEALAAYLQRGRPRCQDRHLFLRVKAPTAGLKADGVTKVVHAACRRAGLPVVGAHRLRRTSACATPRGGGAPGEGRGGLPPRSGLPPAPYAKADRCRAPPLRPPSAGART